MSSSFEWDNKKEKSNIEKHNVSFVEAQEAFFDPDRIIFKDDKHSDSEDRFFCLGKLQDNVLTVRFTMRDKVIRIIGAAYWRKGKKIYEQTNK